MVRELLSYLPQNNLDAPPFLATDDPPDRAAPELATIIPDVAHQALRHDRGHRAGRGRRRLPRGGPALRAEHRRSGYARLAGHVVGVVGNQPKALAGVLDIDASIKAARFVRFCDAFNIPIVTLVDVPGFLPGTTQEYNGIILHGAKLLYAYARRPCRS